MKIKKHIMIATLFLSAFSSEGETNENASTKEEKINLEIESKQYGSDGQFKYLNNNKTKKIAILKLSKRSVENPYKLVSAFVQAYENDDIVGMIIIEKNYSAETFIADLILELKNKKPVVGYILWNSQSAAYDIISATSYIIATSSSYVGGIGVIYAQNGDGIKKHETPENIIVIETKKPSEESIKASTQRYYDDFCKNIAKRRSLNLEEKSVWAEGQIFTSEQALNLKLIDKIGSFKDCVTTLNELISKRNSSDVSENFEFIDLTPLNEKKDSNKGAVND